MKKSRSSIFGEDDEPNATRVIKKRKLPRAISAEPSNKPEETTVDDYMNYPLETPQEVSTQPQPHEVSLFKSKQKSIGLSMMEKMGFNANADNIQQPVAVTMKRDRKGIGASTVAVIARDNRKETYKSYVGRLKETMSKKKLENQIHKLRKLCYDMSGEHDMVLDNALEASETNVLWRSYAEGQQQKEQQQKHHRTRIDTERFEQPLDSVLISRPDFEIIDTADTLVDLLQYLRNEHSYCWYCGIRYNDEQDLKENCPGVLEEDHLTSE